MHDRFILTDQCGFSVPSGLECSTQHDVKSTDWSFLDDAAARLRWRDFFLSASLFDLVKTKEIS
jgi:hypothetical protein